MVCAADTPREKARESRVRVVDVYPHGEAKAQKKRGCVCACSLTQERSDGLPPLLLHHISSNEGDVAGKGGGGELRGRNVTSARDWEG